MPVTAETVTVELLAKTDQFSANMASARQKFVGATKDMESAATSSGAAISKSHDNVAASAGRSNATNLILQSTIRRTSDQFAAGASAATIFAEHLGALAEAAEMSGGAFGKVGEVLAGPWGLALQAGVALLSIFISEEFDAADATTHHAKAAKDLSDAIAELNKLTGAANLTDQQRVGVQIAAARTEYSAALATREHTKALLEQAIAQENADKAGVQSGMADRGDMAGIGLGISSARVQGLTAELDDVSRKADETGKRLNEAFKGAVGQSIVASVEAETDKAAAANKRYTDSVTKLRQANRDGALSDRDLANAVREQVRERDAAVKAAQRGHGGGGSAAADADDQARLATATNGVQKAEAELAITRRQGAADLKAGKITQQEYEDRLEAARDKLNGAREAQDANTKSTREAIAAQRELVGFYDQLRARLDPLSDAYARYKEQLVEIAKLQALPANNPAHIDAATADQYRRTAANDLFEQDDRINAQQDKERRDNIFGGDPNAKLPGPKYTADELKPFTEAAREQERQQEQLHQQQEKDTQTLAGFYEKIFEGGTKNIWKTFKEEGEKEIAYLLAKLTVLQLTQGGSILGNAQSVLGSAASPSGAGNGGLGGLFGSIVGGIGKIFGGGGGIGASGLASVAGGTGDVDSLVGLGGWATGGSAIIGGNPGVDKNVLSLNGVPFKNVGMGEMLTVTPPNAINPNMRVNPAGGPPVVHQTIQVDARGAVMNDQFASQILARAANHATAVAGQAGQAAYGAAVRDANTAAPGAVRRYQQAKG